MLRDKSLEREGHTSLEIRFSRSGSCNDSLDISTKVNTVTL